MCVHQCMCVWCVCMCDVYVCTSVRTRALACLSQLHGADAGFGWLVCLNPPSPLGVPIISLVQDHRLLGAASLKSTDSPSPGSHQLPRAAQVGLGVVSPSPSPSMPGICAGLISEHSHRATFAHAGKALSGAHSLLCCRYPLPTEDALASRPVHTASFSSTHNLSNSNIVSSKYYLLREFNQVWRRFVECRFSSSFNSFRWQFWVQQLYN